MATQEITMDVGPDAAEVFHNAPPELRDKLGAAVAEWLREREFKESTRELERIMDDIGANARERGLTKEKLEELIADGLEDLDHGRTVPADEVFEEIRERSRARRSGSE